MSKPKGRVPTLGSVSTAWRTIVRPRIGMLFVGLVLLTVNRVCGLVLPGSTQVLLDDAIQPENEALLRGILLIVGAAILVQGVTSFTLTRLLSIQAQRLITDLRIKLQEHVVHLPIGFFDAHKSGVIVSRVMSDVEGVRNLVGTGLVQLIGGLLTSAIAFVLLLRIDPWLTVAGVVPLLAFTGISFFAFRLIRPIFRERSEIRAQVSGRLTEGVAGIRVVKGFHAEAREELVFRDGADRLFENVRRTLTMTALISALATLLMGVASVAIMGFGASQIMAGDLTIGEFVSFTLYLGFMVAPILQIASIGTQITEAFAGLDRMNELLAEPREGLERDRHLEQVVGDLRLEAVGFEYEEGKPVLHDIDLEIPAGSVTALVGSSGSGKTTLAGLAASFLDPTSGTVLIDGVDLATVDLGSYRSRLGVVLQDDFLFEGTIRENLLFVKPDASEREIQDAVTAAHVREFTDRFEDGLETVIGERGVKLSGGQRQRVSIARAILADPRVLILDEATSNLDTESESLVQESLEQLMQGRTTLVIAHRLSTIHRADQIVVLEEGRIVERGRHDELIARQGRYHKLYTVQARI